MIYRRIFIPSVCVVLLASLLACNGTNGRARLDSKIQPILHRLDSTTQPVVAARVVELQSGRELYAENDDQPMIPASNLKLFVSAAALDFFGPDYAFKTYLAMDGDDLWIIGTGDPGTSDPSIAGKRGPGNTPTTLLDDWTRAFRDRGITQIKGALYYYEGAFEDVQIHPSWAKEDLVHWYAAPISGLNFNDNCVDITIYPTEDGKPVRYEVVPPVTNIKIVNNCISGSKDEPTIDRAQGENTYTIGGGCTKKTALKSKPVTNPGAFFADALRTNLKSNGIEIVGPTERAAEPLGGQFDPPAAKVIAVHETTMRELLPRINKNSQNLLAEGTCKLLGRAYELKRGRDVPGSWQSGSDAIHAFLVRNGIDDSQIVIADGSGLSRQNRVTTRAISDLLVVMRRHRYGEVFYESLSVGGIDGTISNRFKDMPGIVHAKTGYIGGVRSLSGYAPSRRSEIVFSMIYNKIPGPVKPYEELQDYAIRLLMTWPDLDYTPPPATQPATRPATQPLALVGW